MITKALGNYRTWHCFVVLLDKKFSYNSWRDLSWQYQRTDPNLISGQDTWKWRYRYNAMGEREQKRKVLAPGGDSTASNGYEWSYYLLGGSKEQLSLWEGLQTSDTAFCLLPGGGGSYVHLYATEYLVYGVEYPGIKEDIPRIRLFPNNQTEYRITDHLASVRTTLNQSGTVTNTYNYEPFGDIIGGGTEARQGFNSREKDQELGLFNNGVRKLDDEEGRFTSIDPLWEKFSAWSPYQYGYNNPIAVTDPSGMQGSPFDLTNSELRFVVLNPVATTIVFNNSQDAIVLTDKTFSERGLPDADGGHNDTKDAFRHALWSAMNARDVGVIKAEQFGDAHEDKEQPEEEKNMDLHNNAVGYYLGSHYPDFTDEQYAEVLALLILGDTDVLQTSPTSEGTEDGNSHYYGDTDPDYDGNPGYSNDQ